MSLITIVVPMYNEYKNINGCVDTLKRQSNQNFDVIFVDDGSTDHTVDKLQSILDSGVKFAYKVIKQDNRGAAEARRAGILQSSSEYILFLDCDDKLSINMVDEIYKEYSSKYDIDMFIPNLKVQKDTLEWKQFNFYTDNYNLSPSDCVLNTLNGWQVHGCFCIKRHIYIKSYEEYLRYNVKNMNYLNNDEIITRLNFKNSKKIIRCDSDYYYCFNESSTTNRINPKKYLSLINAVILHDILSQDHRFNNSVKKHLVNEIYKTLKYLNRHYTDIDNKNQWEKLIKDKVNGINYFEYVTKLNLKSNKRLLFLKVYTLLSRV